MNDAQLKKESSMLIQQQSKATYAAILTKKLMIVSAMIGLGIFPVQAEVTVEEVKQQVLKELQTQTRAASPANAFNPAMGLTLDAVAGHTRQNRGSFDFRSAELSLSAAVDPFAKLYGVINGTPDEGLEVEEAFFMTTSLPYNLTIRGGRLFANFGRLPHWHDHELPFVNRTDSLDTFIDGEAKADGFEVMHLFKTPFFLQGTFGMYSKLGAENERLSETGADGHSKGRPGNAFTYLAKLSTYLSLGDNYGVDLGISQALTPKQYYISGVRQDSLYSTPL
jgi:hypothetical protein